MGILSHVPKLSRIAVPEGYRDAYEIQKGYGVEFVMVRVKQPDSTFGNYPNAILRLFSNKCQEVGNR